jgi:motility quorum-sensing regulator/GCU-specific mRNA interferase toxin
MEKGTPHCKLTTVKALTEAGRVNATASAFNGARELGINLFGSDSPLLAAKSSK